MCGRNFGNNFSEKNNQYRNEGSKCDQNDAFSFFFADHLPRGIGRKGYNEYIKKVIEDQDGGQ